jgi:predicted amino acid-binding ACT domain protein
MALKVTQLQLWFGKVDDRPGGTAAVLEPLAKAGVNLEFMLVRRTQEALGKGVIFLAPIEGAQQEQAARATGLSPTGTIAGLRVEGDDQPGAGYAMTRAIADAGVSFRGLSATVLGKKFVCHLAFDSAADASRAAEALAASQKKRTKK